MLPIPARETESVTRQCSISASVPGYGPRKSLVCAWTRLSWMARTRASWCAAREGDSVAFPYGKRRREHCGPGSPMCACTYAGRFLNDRSEALEHVGPQLHREEARPCGAAALSELIEEARLSSRDEAHLCDDQSAGDARYPESRPMARPFQFEVDRNLFAGNIDGENSRPSSRLCHRSSVAVSSKLRTSSSPGCRAGNYPE